MPSLGQYYRALDVAAEAENDDWVKVEQFGFYVLDTTHDGRRYVVVFSKARERRDIRRRVALIAKTATRMLAIEDPVGGCP